MDSDLKLIDDFRKRSKQIRNEELRKKLLNDEKAIRFAEGGSSRKPSKPSFRTMSKHFVRGFVEGTRRISPIPQIAVAADMMTPKPAGSGSDKIKKSERTDHKRAMRRYASKFTRK